MFPQCFDAKFAIVIISALILGIFHGQFNSFVIETGCIVVTVSACVILIITIRKFCISAYMYIGARQTRKNKLEEVKTTKGKLLQKLVGLKLPIENRDTLTNLTYEEIRELLRRRELEAVDLLEAYQVKALEVDRSLNCVNEVVYDADVTALYLDSLPDEKRGRLHGIPLSVKECISLADYDSYIGCVSRCFKPEKETACILQALINEGMIPFMRTNMSQCGLSIGCDNPLFGETVNPLDQKRTCGGSSGGEGALVGGGGSIIGLGTDIGGSVRIPSTHCGIYGFKPTCLRHGSRSMPNWKYQINPLSYLTSTGPMSSDFQLLVDVMKVLFSPALFDLDNNIPRLHFDSETFESDQPMKIGFYTSLSDNSLTLEPIPAVKRAVKLAKAALEARGHTLVEWEPPNIATGTQLLLKSFLADGGETNNQFCKDEVYLSEHMKKYGSASSWHPVMKYLLAKIIWMIDPSISRTLILSIPRRTSYDVVNLAEEIRNYEQECGRSMMEAGIDGIICPVLPYTAPLLPDVSYLIHGAMYTSIYNFLDYPAGVVPTTKVTEGDVRELKMSYPQNSFTTRKLVKTQETSVGMPIGVQCVAMKWQDEKALRLMKEVKEALAEY